MAKAQVWSMSQVACFLSELKKTGNVSASARAAKVTRNSAYEKRKADKQFRADWASALESSLDDLEEGLRKRALEGIDKPVFYGGEKIGDVKSYNDNLGMFLLKARRKDVFGENKDESQDLLEVDKTKVRKRLLDKLTSLEN